MREVAGLTPGLDFMYAYRCDLIKSEMMTLAHNVDAVRRK
jgi:hypothetical protein